MSKIYKIDDAEFEELIKTIALNNESIIENNDPVQFYIKIACDKHIIFFFISFA